MKRIIPIIAVLLSAVLILSACSFEKPQPQENQTENPGSQSDIQQKEYTRGRLNDREYESEYLNLKFTASEDYIMATEEEMKQLSELGMEMVTDEEQKAEIEFSVSNIVYEMMAVHTAGFPNVNLIVEKLPFANLSIDQYLKSLMEKLGGFEGVNITVLDDDEVRSIAGQEYRKITLETAAEGQKLNQNFYLRKIDNLMVVFTLTYLPEMSESSEELINQFTVLK